MTASRSLRLLSIIALLLLIVGCAAQQHINDARRFMQLHDYASAVAHYQQALQIKPELANDPKFMTDLHEAQRQDALVASQRLIAADQPEQAVTRIEATLRELPGDPQLMTALLGARHAAAESLHHRAQHSADQGQLDIAKTQLTEALRYEPQHAASAAALASLTNPDTFDPAVRRAHAAASQSIADRKWQQAADQLAAIITQSPDYLPARADVHTAAAQIAQVQSHLAAAQHASDAKQLDAAITELKAGLDIWPDHAASRSLLNDVVTRRAQATQLADNAADLLGEKKYDQAIAAAQQSLAIFPTFADAQKIDAMARQAAADQAVATAKAALAKADYAAANGAFKKALTYLPKMDDAMVGLASVATAQADVAEQAGRIGLALLFRMTAVDFVPSTVNLQRLTTARNANIAKGAFTLVIDGRGTDATITANSVPLVNELVPLLRRRAPAVMAVNPTPLPNDRPVFSSNLAVARLQVTNTLTAQQQLSQTYLVDVQVPNARLPELRERARRTNDDYQRADRRTDRADDDLRDYKKTHDPAAPDYDDAIKRLQRAADSARRDADKARTAARRAADELKHAPAFVTVQQARQWPFVRQTYTQTASLVATMTLTDAQGHTLAAPMNVDHDVVASDQTTVDANPAIGVPADPLSLPDPVDMQKQAIAQSAGLAAGKLFDAAIRVRAANLQAQADELRKAGKSDRALELEVTAALVTEPLDPKTAAKRLAELRAAATAQH